MISEDKLTSSTAIVVNMLKSLTKEWDYYQNMILPTHNGTDAVDLIGPWPAKTENFSGEFFTLTCIDTTTNLVELVCIDTKSNDIIARKFEQTLLACYPRPIHIIHENGGKFTGFAFTFLFVSEYQRYSNDE